MKIIFETIDQKEQRYPTLGDYWEDADGTIQIRSTKMPDPRYEQLIFLHEYLEFMLCRRRGIKEGEIKEFDEAWEKAGNKGEPGADDDAPYFFEHRYAELQELSLAYELGVSWDAYEKAQQTVWDQEYSQSSQKP